MAIAMPIQQDIRRYDRQGMPHARIARELGVDRGTVAKYAKQEDCSPQPKRDRRFGRKTDAYAALIDQMLEADGKSPFTAHTTNPVPLALVGRDDVKALAEGGVLADLAPTMLDLLGLEQPEEMTGHSLIVK